MEAIIDLQWRKSSYSGNGGQCVELASARERVHVRDSKSTDSPALTFGADQWRLFTERIKRSDDD